MNHGRLFKLSQTMLGLDSMAPSKIILSQYECEHGETISNQSFGSCLRIMYNQPGCFTLDREKIKKTQFYRLTAVDFDQYAGEINGHIY